MYVYITYTNECVHVSVQMSICTCTLVLPRYRKFHIVCRGCLYRDISHITI